MSYNKNGQAQTQNEQQKVFTFNSNNAPIRVQSINDVLWFVAKDVCKALNITWNGKTLAQIPDEWKGMRKFLTPGGEQKLTAITEAGMYKLAFRCQSSEIADKFTNWVASEVLPSLRKSGRYELSGVRKQGRKSITRGELVNADILNLLWLIGESLNYGDQKEIALELGVSVQSVSRTLNGYNRSNRILMALYRKARENRQAFLLYNQPKLMAEHLLSGIQIEGGNHLPAVKFTGSSGRGGQIGNQNARKSGKGGLR